VLDDIRMPTASYTPMIDISERSLRPNGAGSAETAESVHIAPAE
jgi:hypothetical protein